MLEALLIALFALWILGFFFAHVGAAIHLLLMLAIFIWILRAIRKNKPQMQ